MQLKHVKNVANEARIGLDGKTITLYPDAFTNKTELIKTIAHERTHAFQVDVFGKPTSSSMLREFEEGAKAAEHTWMDYLKLKQEGKNAQRLGKTNTRIKRRF